MRTKLIPAVAGLALALTLALFTGTADSRDGTMVAAAEGTPVTAPLVEAETVGVFGLGDLVNGAIDEVEAERAAIIEYATAIEKAKADEAAAAYAAHVAAEEAAAARRAAAERQAAARATAPAGGSVGAIIERHFGAAAGRATAIARCESNLNPSAVSPTNDHGLFQINAVHRGQFEAVTGAPWSAVYDAELNTVYAKHLYDQQGWGPWVCNRKV